MYSNNIKPLLILLCLAAISNRAIAQKDSLAMDEQGRYIYYRVAEAGNIPPDTLYQRALSFLNSLTREKDFKVTVQDAKSLSLTATGFLLVSKPSLGKHPGGQVAYQLKVEIKGQRYRYWLTNYVYTPYHRDRYTSYVPDEGIEIPLENASSKLTKKDVDHYLDDCARFSRQFGESLKIRLLETTAAKKEPSKKVIHIGNW